MMLVWWLDNDNDKKDHDYVNDDGSDNDNEKHGFCAIFSQNIANFVILVLIIAKNYNCITKHQKIIMKKGRERERKGIYAMR